MVPIRRKIQRILRRRMSGLSNGRKRQLSNNPQLSKKRKLEEENEGENVKRRKLST